MKGSDRCDEIVRLIDDILGDAPASARKPATSRAGTGPRWSTRPRPEKESSDRRDLLEAVGHFLAGTTTEAAANLT